MQKQKFDGNIKKRWMLLAAINMLLLLLVFGALIVGFAFFTVSSGKNAHKDAMIDYASRLNTHSLSDIQAACTSDNDRWSADIDNPNIYFAVYTPRGDGSYALLTKTLFISENSPKLGGNIKQITEETIAGYNFLTYTVNFNGQNGSFIKVFTPYDAHTAAIDHITFYSIPFVFAFIIIGVIFSLVWGYMEIKPIMTNYYKQKSFINDMSHEIRTPLAIIKGNLENIIAAPDAKICDVYENIESCLTEVDYMTDMSSGLLNIVRGENKSAKTDASLSDTVSEVVDIYSELTAMSGKALIANIEKCDVKIDREKIKQLMTILFENAIKYTRDGDRITVRLKNAKDGCVLSVSDTGIGVDKNELELIFERFYRAENAKDIQGTGLGLPIAKTIVESMNGTIKAVINIPHGLEILIHFSRGK